MKKIITLFTAASLLTVVGCGGAKPAPQSNMPKSMESSLVESYSASEVTIKATGYGKDNKDVQGAITDLRKSAVYYVLLGGTDGLLNTPDAKRKFDFQKEEFFKNVTPYITWEADKVISQVKTDRGIKMTKMVRVNKEMIRSNLADRGLIESTAALAEAQGMPFIMVIPETPKGQTPLEVFDKNRFAKHAAATIESYLTARQYDVVVPRAQEQLNDLTKMQSEVAGLDEDVSYQLALSLGSDIYITFAGTVENGKASVSVKAYETTTARLLGTETGYSQTRPGTAGEVLVEEAISDAIDKVLQRVTNYWAADLKKGVQYKVIFKIKGEYEGAELENIQFSVADAIEGTFDKSKENVVTSKTLDYVIWANAEEFGKSSKIYRVLKRKLRSKGVTLQNININRKMAILGID